MPVVLQHVANSLSKICVCFVKKDDTAHIFFCQSLAYLKNALSTGFNYYDVVNDIMSEIKIKKEMEMRYIYISIFT